MIEVLEISIFIFRKDLNNVQWMLLTQHRNNSTHSCAPVGAYSLPVSPTHVLLQKKSFNPRLLYFINKNEVGQLKGSSSCVAITYRLDMYLQLNLKVVF